jgi:hypothetical protein
MHPPRYTFVVGQLLETIMHRLRRSSFCVAVNSPRNAGAHALRTLEWGVFTVDWTLFTILCTTN